MELTDSKVLFMQDSHTYLLGHIDLKGITSTLIPAIFGDYTEKIPQEVLRRAAERGTRIHQSIAMVEDGFEYEGYEINEYLRLRDERHLVPVKSEYIVTDGKHFASAIDKVYEGDIIADIKTTSELHYPQALFQLSWYATYYEYLNGRRVQQAYLIWLPKPQYGRCAFVEVELVAPDVIKDIVATYLRGEDVTQYAELFGAKKGEAVEAARLPVVINNIASNIIAFERQMHAIKVQYDEYKEQYKTALIEYFVQTGERKIEYDGDTITYIAPTTRVSIDSKALKADHPDMYEQYKRETAVSESVRITVR